MSRVIKRYENRKLYDTAQRQYVSLEEIAGLIREGVDVQVVDNNTGDDITTQTLTQVIFEEGKKGLNPLSKDLLHDLIRLGNTIIGGGLQQVRLGLDRLMPDSLNRILGADHSEDLKQLQKRVESLEAIIKALANNTPNKQGEA
jgi:polyhydroxyalkanoate synthesis repressor PhaR